MSRGAVLLAAAAAFELGLFVGCKAFQQIDEINDPADDVALKRCRQEMRAARDAGADARAAFGVYVDCTIEAGLR